MGLRVNDLNLQFLRDNELQELQKHVKGDDVDIASMSDNLLRAVNGAAESKKVKGYQDEASQGVQDAYKEDASNTLDKFEKGIGIPGTSQAISSASGYGKGFLGNSLDEAVGAVSAILPGTPSYTEARDRTRAFQDVAQERNPVSSGAGQFVGAVMGPGKILGNVAKGANSVAGAIGMGALTGGLETAGAQIGSQKEITPSDKEIEEFKTNVPLSMGIGAASAPVTRYISNKIGAGGENVRRAADEAELRSKNYGAKEFQEFATPKKGMPALAEETSRVKQMNLPDDSLKLAQVAKTKANETGEAIKQMIPDEKVFNKNDILNRMEQEATAKLGHSNVGSRNAVKQEIDKLRQAWPEELSLRDIHLEKIHLKNELGVNYGQSNEQLANFLDKEIVGSMANIVDEGMRSSPSYNQFKPLMKDYGIYAKIGGRSSKAYGGGAAQQPIPDIPATKSGAIGKAVNSLKPGKETLNWLANQIQNKPQSIPQRLYGPLVKAAADPDSKSLALLHTLLYNKDQEYKNYIDSQGGE